MLKLVSLCSWSVLVTVWLWWLGDSSSPTEASAEVTSRLQDYASINSSNSDTKQLAVVAFLYVFCSIAPTNGWDLITLCDLKFSLWIYDTAVYSKFCVDSSKLFLLSRIVAHDSEFCFQFFFVVIVFIIILVKLCTYYYNGLGCIIVIY